MNAAVHRFRVGSLECLALSDGYHVYSADLYVSNADPGEVERALAEHGDSPGRIVSPYTCMLVETAGELVLVDTGGGAFDATVGRLPESLRAAGVAPEDIDLVVLTHAHPDHIGGNVGEAGRPRYPNARWAIPRNEWAFWTTEKTLATVPPLFRRFAEENLRPIAGAVVLTDGEAEVAPGIRMLPTPGHTPGHAAVVVADGEEELLYISDVALHPVHLEHPEWHPIYDLDPAGALASKRTLFDRTAENGSLVLAYHFAPFPCLGHVTRSGRGWRWQPSP